MVISNGKANIYANKAWLEKVLYLSTSDWPTLSKEDSSTTYICIWIGTSTVAMARLDRVCHNHNIRFALKYKLYKSLVVPIPLYGCETWTLLAETERDIQTSENNLSARRDCSGSRTVMDDFVDAARHTYVGHQKPLIATVRQAA